MTDFRQSIDGFVASAREYCAWVEGSPSPSDPFDAQRLLSRLHANAVTLPGVDDEFVPGADQIAEMSLDAWKAALRRFSAFPFQEYWEIFNPLTTEPEEPVCGDIADDFADTYRDVKQGLLAYERGLEPQAVWYWRFSWGAHWGGHATSALRALHAFERIRE